VILHLRDQGGHQTILFRDRVVHLVFVHLGREKQDRLLVSVLVPLKQYRADAGALVKASLRSSTACVALRLKENFVFPAFFKGLYTFFIFKKSKIFLLLYLKEQLLENIFPNLHRDSSSRKKVTGLLTGHLVARIN